MLRTKRHIQPTLLIATLLAAGPHAAAAPPRVPIARASNPPVIDGRLDDAVWASAAVITDFRQVDPVEFAEPSERTEVRLLMDADALYVAFRCHDRDPGAIIGTRMKRDASLGPDDRVSFIIDPYDDQRNGFFFEMNPAGARGDALIEENSRFIKNWDGIWYGRASIDDGGWVAEMAIPFKTISFNPDATEWRFNASRFIRRRNESIEWASPARDTSFNSFADAGILEGIRDLNQGVGLDIKPFGVVTVKRDHDENRGGIDIDGGLDAFYKLTPAMTLSLTVNTDFAETEVDERRINLTRFPLFFPEKRDFFLQDTGIFDFGGIRRNPLPFFSRRIGRGRDGAPADILAGIKLTGRAENLNLGLLDVQMQHDDELGNKNLFVGRASVDVLEQSTFGGIFTYGDPQAGDDNWIGGVDFNYRTSDYAGDKTIDGNAFVLVSGGAGPQDQATSFGGRIGYPNDRVDWRVGFTQIDSDYTAPLGFVPRPGIREYFGNWRYRWRPENSWIRSIDTGVNGFFVTDLDDEVESRSLDFDLLTVRSQLGDRLSFQVEREREVLDEPFEIREGIVIPVADHRFDRFGVELSTSSGRPVDFEVSYEGGDFFNGTRDDYQVELSWRPSRHLELGGEFEMNDVDLPGGSFITRIIRSRVDVYFTPDVTWSTFVQFDNVSDSIGINSRLRWIIEPGNELFVVLNQAVGRFDDRFRVTDTAVTTKLGWTFRY
ncbi:MAG: carbohydrate binding family 9 domain-containing protein [Phycisphaerales bacterium]|nr:carbohydrate binding family 9 domain-containing protein [Phycisphaerae bacterium]NNM26382.1 carbohydrate binding family 9 domain-containing protein [Phycisphaerales bacterium]